MRLAPEAMMGLIAHETEHSFVGGRDCAEDEALANDKARILLYAFTVVLSFHSQQIRHFQREIFMQRLASL